MRDGLLNDACRLNVTCGRPGRDTSHVSGAGGRQGRLWRPLSRQPGAAARHACNQCREQRTRQHNSVAPRTFEMRKLRSSLLMPRTYAVHLCVAASVACGGEWRGIGGVHTQ